MSHFSLSYIECPSRVKSAIQERSFFMTAVPPGSGHSPEHLQDSEIGLWSAISGSRVGRATKIACGLPTSHFGALTAYVPINRLGNMNGKVDCIDMLQLEGSSQLVLTPYLI